MSFHLLSNTMVVSCRVTISAFSLGRVSDLIGRYLMNFFAES